MRRNVCCLASGGVESAAMLVWLARRYRSVFPVYIRGGHAWEKAELHSLRRLLRALKRRAIVPLSVLDLPVRDCYRASHWSISGRGVPGAKTRDEAVYLPGRNILLLAKAAAFGASRGIGEIAIGTLSSNPFPDGNAGFFRLMSRTLSAGLGRSIRVIAPFGDRDKVQVVRGDGEIPWRLTFSCIAPIGRTPCGKCNKCAERRSALLSAGLTA